MTAADTNYLLVIVTTFFTLTIDFTCDFFFSHSLQNQLSGFGVLTSSIGTFSMFLQFSIYFWYEYNQQ